MNKYLPLNINQVPSPPHPSPTHFRAKYSPSIQQIMLISNMEKIS